MKTTIVTVILAATSLFATQANANLKAIQAEMNAFQKPQIEAFRKALETDSEYKTYLAELKSLTNIKDAEQRMKMGIAVNEKHKGLFDRAMKKSKADPESNRKYAKKLQKKYSFKGIQYHIEPGLYMTYAAWLESREQEQPPVETEVNFAAPYEFEHSSYAGNGYKTIDLETGEFTANADSIFIGSFKNKAGLGDYIRVPWATRSIRVTAKLPETYVYLAAYAGPGGSGAAGSSVIDVLTEDGARCVKTREHGVVIAPVVWHASLDMEDTTILACEMFAPPANQDIVVRFQSVADVTSGGVAFGYATVSSKPAPIRVRLIE